MRDYSVVTPAFWIGDTGKLLRGDANSQVLAMYLMSSPHSTMTGVFHCPILYMAHETGMGIEGATKALARLSEVGFCEYDEASEVVFVTRMASFQVAESLKPGDNRIIGLRKELAKMTPAHMKAKFLAIYSVAFCLVEEPPKDPKPASPLIAPPKPRTGSRTRTLVEAPPEGVAEQVWEDFIKLRKTKKAPVTETVINGIRKEAATISMSLGDALAMCCERGWQGFDASWVKNIHSSGTGGMFAGAI